MVHKDRKHSYVIGRSSLLDDVYSLEYMTDDLVRADVASCCEEDCWFPFEKMMTVRRNFFISQTSIASFTAVPTLFRTFSWLGRVMNKYSRTVLINLITPSRVRVLLFLLRDDDI